MAQLTGVITTTGPAANAPILSNQRVIDMSDVIHLLDPNEAPLTALTMKLRSSVCVNPKFEWLEDDYIPATTTTGATAATDSTTITVADGSIFRVGDVVKHLASGEVLYVSAATTTTTVGVVRSVGATAGAAFASGDLLMVIGNANAENSTNRTLKAMQKVANYNYTQIFRWEFGASGTLMASELYGGNELTYQQKVAGKQFRIQIEKSFLFGERSQGMTSGGDVAITNDSVIRFTGGVYERITTNAITTTQLSLSSMETMLRMLFRYGPPRKMVLASPNVLSFISLLAAAKLQTVPTDKTFPLAITEYISPHGKCYLVKHNLFGKDGTSAYHASTNPYAGLAMGLDLDNIHHRYLRGRNTMLRTNLQANDADGRIDGYLAECGVQLVSEKNHIKWTAITETA